MSQRLASEEGFSIAIAMVLMSIMLSAGIVSFAYVDTEQDQSRVQRVDESAFNLGEGALNAQAFVLSRHWPSATSGRVYQDCTQATAPTAFCPQPAAIAASFDSVDYRTGQPAWKTTVRDDDGTPFYKTAIASRPANDANANGQVWVRAEATYTVGPRAGRSRAMVALVKVEEINIGERFPERTVIAGRFKTDNNGNKVIVDTKSTTTSPHPVTVRCTNVDSPSCLEYARNHPQQITPPGSIQGGQYIDQDAAPEDTQRALKEKAQTDGTYYATGCPSSLTGKVVWIETASCSYTGSSTYNSASAPGVVVFGSGTLSLSGTTNFYGVINMLNDLNSTNPEMVNLQGNAEVVGRIFVDGPGGIGAGSSGVNLVYDDFKGVVNPFTTYGTAAIVQNSWRELDG